ncbi:MAG: dTMP kinase [Xanthomonadales bacterium]|nr:dTMP kinase [Xanthomonadales bacterium]
MTEPASGRFISLEGGEGAGKSSALATCREHLAARGLEVVLTREPGGTPLAERIREMMLDPDLPVRHAETELLLVFAARAEHVRQTIRPALARGAWVLSDRFVDSSYAYQGGGRGLPEAIIQALEGFTVGQTRPDLTLLLDLPVADGMARAGQRAQGNGCRGDRIEAEPDCFFERVRTVFGQRAAAEPQRFQVIDAGQPLPAVADALRQALDRFIDRVQAGALAAP